MAYSRVYGWCISSSVSWIDSLSQMNKEKNGVSDVKIVIYI